MWENNHELAKIRIWNFWPCINFLGKIFSWTWPVPLCSLFLFALYTEIWLMTGFTSSSKNLHMPDQRFKLLFTVLFFNLKKYQLFRYSYFTYYFLNIVFSWLIFSESFQFINIIWNELCLDITDFLITIT